MDSNLTMELGKNITLLCRERNLTLSGLARLSGVKQPTLHGWTTGRSVQNLNDLKRVCEVLQVSLHTLIFGVKDPFENPDNELLKELFKGDIRVTIHKVNP